jgi:hypothetical protein
MKSYFFFSVTPYSSVEAHRHFCLFIAEFLLGLFLSTLRRKEIIFSETSLNFYWTAIRYNEEDRDLQSHSYDFS